MPCWDHEKPDINQMPGFFVYKHKELAGYFFFRFIAYLRLLYLFLVYL